MSTIEVRQGRIEDYPAFLEAERKAWEDSGVPLISYDQFASWVEVFPEGLLLAVSRGEICGHVFSQLCNFDPNDHSDRRNWDEITDGGTAKRTHDPSGRTMYNVSTSASGPGAGRKLLRHAFEDTRRRGLRYYVGASSISGVTAYADRLERPLDAPLVEEYVAAVLRRHGLRQDEGPKVADPVVSITLATENTTYFRLLENYFHYPASGNWAMLLGYVNPDWTG